MEVRAINVAALLNSVGVLHSKLLIADRKHFYLGSANLSDRGLTRTKEMGVLITNCPNIAQDAAKLFEVSQLCHMLFLNWSCINICMQRSIGKWPALEQCHKHGRPALALQLTWTRLS